MATSSPVKLNYGVDAPNVLRNLFLFGALCIVLVFITPRVLHLGHVDFTLHPMFAGTGILLLIEASLFLLYVKFGKLPSRFPALPAPLAR